MSKTLYWVKFVDQSNGQTIDTYFTAESLTDLDNSVADIMEIKVINEVIDLTEDVKE